MQNLIQNGEPQRYSWGMQKKKILWVMHGCLSRRASVLWSKTDCALLSPVYFCDFGIESTLSEQFVWEDLSKLRIFGGQVNVSQMIVWRGHAISVYKAVSTETTVYVSVSSVLLVCCLVLCWLLLVFVAGFFRTVNTQKQFLNPPPLSRAHTHMRLSSPSLFVHLSPLSLHSHNYLPPLPHPHLFPN